MIFFWISFSFNLSANSSSLSYRMALLFWCQKVPSCYETFFLHFSSTIFYCPVLLNIKYDFNKIKISYENPYLLFLSIHLIFFLLKYFFLFNIFIFFFFHSQIILFKFVIIKYLKYLFVLSPFIFEAFAYKYVY